MTMHTSEEEQSSSKRCLNSIFSSFVRLIVLAYSVLGVFGFFEIQILLYDNRRNNASFQIKDETLFVTLVLCFPGRLQVGGWTIMDTTNVTSPAYVDAECLQLDYLMIACAASLLFASAGCILFVFCDCLARFPCCPFDMNSSSGMAIFLSFILGQTGITIGALAEQNHHWVQFFKTAVEERDLDLDVKSKSRTVVLMGCSLSSFVVGFLIMLDAALSRCCGHQPTTKQNIEEEEKKGQGILGRIRQGRETYNTAMIKGDNDQEIDKALTQANNATDEEENAGSHSRSRNHAILPSWNRY